MVVVCLFLTCSAAGMDILNGAIDSLMGSSNREDWTPVDLNVADATVTISKEKVRHICCSQTALNTMCQIDLTKEGPQIQTVI